ncbi:GH92 family glycosyl hydrolase [Lentzea sp. NPDC059081]|uniref:GH92 family glycosyl hydrolase n=1 Tax=Lentzea sp. NPDC059081 TaxID=3346719 RepID=UPI0036A64204
MRVRFAVAAVVAVVLGAPTAAVAAPTTMSAPVSDPVSDPVAHVDPMIGTGKGGATVGEINNFPGPSTPFGMMQFSPDTQGSYAGYQYHSDRIRGFSLTHASVGCTAFGDVPLLPVTGDVGTAPWDRTEEFTHDGEQAEPGYYAVTAGDVRTELTASTRTGLATFTYPEGSTPQVLVKAGGSLAGNSRAQVRITGDRELSGMATSGDFCGKGNVYTLYYQVAFDQPFTAHGTWDGRAVTPGADSADASRAGAYLTFGSGVVRAKVSMSYVSVDGARANMAAEVPGWDFAAVRKSTRDAWSSALGKIRVAGRDPAQLRSFYTAFYHSLMHPNTFDDADGQYIGFDNQVRTLPRGRHQYANFSDWDTYRSLAPLQAMLFPREASDMAQSLTNDAVQGGWWPRWPVANDYTGQMTGDSSVALVSALHAFGARDFDVKTALKYLVKGATSVDNTPGAYRERPGIEQYVARGYMPNNDAARGDHARVGASITLEWAVDDFAIARFAQAIGEPATAREFSRRGQYWQNVFNPITDHVAPRGQDGRFPDGPGFVPPRPGKFGQNGFDEGNAAQYSWMVPQNPAGLVTAMGGPAAVSQRLDTFFQKLNIGPNEPYMWIGNEPNFGVPWLYNHVGQPWKAQEVVRRIATTLFSATPDGAPGNDDLGAMSSWYVWAALGIYPSTPGTADLVVHSPLFERAVISLPNGRKLDIRAPEAATDTPYVHRLDLDGHRWDRTYLPGDTFHDGGRLDFALAATPDQRWAANSTPPSYRDGEKPFLAEAATQVVVEPGATSTVEVSAQRLGGRDRSLGVTTEAPAGLTVTGPRRVDLDDRTGSGKATLTVAAAAGTPEGYRELPLTVRGAGGTSSTSSVVVLVTKKDGLAAAYSDVGVSDDGDVGSADLDGAGNSYSRQSLAAAGLVGGATYDVAGTAFTWPTAPAGRPDNVVPAGQSIALGTPATRLTFVGAATNGDQRATAKVTFTDGSTAEADLSFGDWVLPGGGQHPVFGNTQVARAEYRNRPKGPEPGASVFATTPFEAPEGKQIASVTLPTNANIHVFAIGQA